MPQREGIPLLITFSGLDGSGKSTQIENLRAHLRALGWRVASLAFWDDVVVGKRYREGFVHKVYKSEKGVGEPGKPVERRDKNVRRWYLSLARHGLYLLDAIHACEVLARARRGRPTVIIMDRYVYDELANLNLENPASRSFAQAVHRLVPRPDVAFFLDAEPYAARARKPEYPLDFLEKSRASYMGLAKLLGTITVVPPGDVETVRGAVLSAVQEAMAGRRDGIEQLGPAAA
jgi:thymidylate kinase